MFLWDHIERWRLKPRSWRRAFSLFLATSLTLLIIALWLVNSWIISFYTDEARLVERQSSPGVLMRTTDRIKTGWSVLWGKTKDN